MYPSEGIHRRWDSGYRITSTAATWDQSALVLSIPRRKPGDETQETLRTSQFPSVHVKVQAWKLLQYWLSKLCKWNISLQGRTTLTFPILWCRRNGQRISISHACAMGGLYLNRGIAVLSVIAEMDFHIDVFCSLFSLVNCKVILIRVSVAAEIRQLCF